MRHLLGFWILLVVFASKSKTEQTAACSKPRFHMLELVYPFPAGGVPKYHEIKLRCTGKYFEQIVIIKCMLPGNVNEWSVPHPECKRVTCPDPGSLLNGHFQLGSLHGVNGTLEYACNQGYWYTGTVRRICQRDGTWSGVGGICTAILCGDLPEVQHGIYSSPPPYYYRDSIGVTCDRGYVYTGDRELSCTGHQKWTGDIGRCRKATEVKCLFPEIPFILQPVKMLYAYEDEVTVKCQDGYIGSFNLKCQATGSWSGIHGHCERIICPYVEVELEHGKIHRSDKQKYEYRDQLNLACDEGYVYDGSISECGKDGKWSSSIGTCLPIESSYHSYPEDPTIIIGPIIVFIVGAILLYAFIEKFTEKKQNSATDSRDCRQAAFGKEA